MGHPEARGNDPKGVSCPESIEGKVRERRWLVCRSLGEG